MPLIARLFAGVLLASALALAATRARALSRSGGGAAFVVGTVACAAGWNWAVVLLAFFLSSSGLSRWRKRAKDEATRSTVEKGGARDAWQVLANGGVFLFASLGEVLLSDARWALLALGALSAATADTWATEIGTAIGGVPRRLFDWREVPRGTSGAVSVAGMLAMCVGALFLGTVARAAGFAREMLLPTIVGGVVGALADTIAGATIQERRWCPHCERATERHVHDCGSVTMHVGGMRGMTNDAVNLTSCVVGGAVALVCGSAWA